VAEKAPEKAPKKAILVKKKDELQTFLMSGAATAVVCGANSSGQFRIQFLKNGNQHHCLSYDSARGCIQGLRALMDLPEVDDQPDEPLKEVPAPTSPELLQKLRQKTPLVGQPVIQASAPFSQVETENRLERFLCSGRVDETYFLSWDDTKKHNVVVKQMSSVKYNTLSVKQSNKGYETLMHDVSVPDTPTRHKNYKELHEKLTDMLEK